MLDFSHVADGTPGVNIQRFYGVFGGGQTTTNITLWQTWVKPRGVKFVYIICVGAGASGAVGTFGVTPANVGAQGGGSGGQTAAFWPAIMIPDVLYVQPGVGGRQPTTLVSGATNVAGTNTYVAVEPITTTTSNLQELLIYANGAAGLAGGGAIGLTASPMGLGRAASFTGFAGQSGGTGGATQNGAGGAIAIPITGIMVTGGAGSGGMDVAAAASGAGGAVTGSGSIFPTHAGGVASSASSANGGDGIDGRMITPYLFYGGSGGGGGGFTASSLGGRGGNGAPGCGGGASGPGHGVTTGRPGDGGDGFVYIISW